MLAFFVEPSLCRGKFGGRLGRSKESVHLIAIYPESEARPRVALCVTQASRFPAIISTGSGRFRLVIVKISRLSSSPFVHHKEGCRHRLPPPSLPPPLSSSSSSTGWRARPGDSLQGRDRCQNFHIQIVLDIEADVSARRRPLFLSRGEQTFEENKPSNVSLRSLARGIERVTRRKVNGFFLSFSLAVFIFLWLAAKILAIFPTRNQAGAECTRFFLPVYLHHMLKYTS